MTWRSHRRARRSLEAAGLGAFAAALVVPSLAFAAPPSATFSFAPDPPTSGETVEYDASASQPASGEAITAYSWDLDGDGAFDDAAGPTASFSYPTPGPRTVRLRVDADSGDFATTERIFSVRNRPPTVSFEFAPQSPRAGEALRLFSTSFDPDGPLVSHDWDLDGDGEFDDTTGRNPEITFEEPGRVTVGLRVVDADGAAAEVTAPIVVVAPDFKLLSPFPVVRLAGELRRSGNTEVTRLSVRAPRGTDVTVRCRGKSCPFERRHRVVAKRRVRFPEIKAVLQPGSVIKVFVTDPERIGKLTSFKIRDRKAPKRFDKCLRGDSEIPIPCPPS